MSWNTASPSPSPSGPRNRSPCWITERWRRCWHGYQAESGITLEASQIDALAVANANPIAVITGGAGTGKTTVLRACFRICTEAGWPVFAMALSGRAARRIGEATGHPATTIAGFLTRFNPDVAPRSGPSSSSTKPRCSICRLPIA
jgi:hypothetical protein